MIRINLLKPEKKEIPRRDDIHYLAAEETGENKVSTLAALIALFLTIGIIGGGYFMQNSRQNKEERLYKDSQARLSKLENELKLLAEAEKSAQEVAQKIEIINNLKAQQPNAMIMMDKFSLSLPDWIWLTKLTYHQYNLNIEGKAISNNLIVDLINNLGNSGYFTNVQLNSSVRRQESGIDVFDFKINCAFKRPAESQKVI